jgi:hypothetical protein
MEKLMHKHDRDDVFKEDLLYGNLFSYETGEFVETALQNVVACI